MKSLLQKSEYWVSRFCKVVLFICILCIVIMAFVQVFLRFVFNINISWVDENCRYLQVFITYVGAGLAMKTGGHISIDLLRAKLSGVSGRILDVFGMLLGMVFSGVLLYYGFNLTRLQMFQTTAATGIPMGIIYIALPLGGLLILYYSIVNLFNIMRPEEVPGMEEHF